MNIVLAVDGSKNSLDAVSSLIKHVGWFKSPPTVRLVYVHLPVPKVGGFSKKTVDKYYREEGDECLAKAKKLLDKAGIAHEDMILVGQPAETICEVAADGNADLIYMGTRGMSSLANMVVGSVASKVVQHAKVPVLLAR